MQQADALRTQHCLADALAISDRVLAADPADHGAHRMCVPTPSEFGSSRLAAELPAHERERIGSRVRFQDVDGRRRLRTVGDEEVDTARAHRRGPAARCAAAGSR